MEIQLPLQYQCQYQLITQPLILKNKKEHKLPQIDTINRLVKRENKIFKLIAETGLMSEIELELICKIANDLKIDYLKTSTGVNGAGANMEVVTAMREMLDKNIKIKASGGIRTRAAAY